MDTFKDHFSTVASRYQAFRPGYPPALFAWLASVSPGRERAVDLGCGTGQASVAWGRPEHRRPVTWDLTVRAGLLVPRDGEGDPG